MTTEQTSSTDKDWKLQNKWGKWTLSGDCLGNFSILVSSENFTLRTVFLDSYLFGFRSMSGSFHVAYKWLESKTSNLHSVSSQLPTSCHIFAGYLIYCSTFQLWFELKPPNLARSRRWRTVEPQRATESCSQIQYVPSLPSCSVFRHTDSTVHQTSLFGPRDEISSKTKHSLLIWFLRTEIQSHRPLRNYWNTPDPVYLYLYTYIYIEKIQIHNILKSIAPTTCACHVPTGSNMRRFLTSCTSRV